MGQSFVPDMTLEKEFGYRVKSINEFIARFNGYETKPDIPKDSLARRNNIISLFDIDMSHEGLDDKEFRQEIMAFVDSASTWEGKICLDSEALAEATCRVKYNKQEYLLSMFLKREISRTGQDKWSVTGLRGLRALGLYNDKRLTISPVDHEIYFISLQDIFQENKPLVPFIRSNDKEIDELSFFFALCMTGAMDFVQIEGLKIHFWAVPGYAFEINEINREGSNSGWLITKLQQVPEVGKEVYVRNLLSTGQKPK